LLSLTTRHPTHQAHHSVNMPVLALKDSLQPQDSSPDPGTLSSSLMPSSCIGLRWNSTRTGIARQRNGIYVPWQSSPEDSASGGEIDPFVAIPFPCTVSSKHVPSPNPLNVPSSSQSDSGERGVSTSTILCAGSGTISDAGGGSMQPHLPHGQFQSEVDGASWHRQPRPNSYNEFSAKPCRSCSESMVNLGVVLGKQASASDLMACDATVGSMSRQMLVIREEGKPLMHIVSVLSFTGRRGFG
jgi:hypothetical protein